MKIRTVYASQTGAALDSNVFTGGGTDDTVVLQGVLDSANDSEGLLLIMDGAALVTGLRIHSNTTIKCLDRNCGFFQKAWSNCPLIRNADVDAYNIKNRYICLDGGTYNQNCGQQIHHHDTASTDPQNAEDLAFHWVMLCVFIGVENLRIQNLAFRNQRTFTVLIQNFKHVDIENIEIELPDKMFAQNQDGLHFWGPGQYLTIRNVKGNSGDDFIALAPDEHDYKSTITDVLIDGIILEDADQAIRMLVRKDGFLDRVVVKNVIGTYRSFGFFINPWFENPEGHYGNITIDTVDLRQKSPDYTYTTNMLFRLGGVIESITLKNIKYHKPIDNRVLFEIGAARNVIDPVEEESKNSHIHSLVIDGLQVYEDGQCSGDEDFSTVRCPVDHMVVRNVEVLRREGMEEDGSFINVMEGGSIDTLIMNSMSISKLDSLVKMTGGSIGTLKLDNILYNKVNKTIDGNGVAKLIETGVAVKE